MQLLNALLRAFNSPERLNCVLSECRSHHITWWVAAEICIRLFHICLSLCQLCFASLLFVLTQEMPFSLDPPVLTSFMPVVCSLSARRKFFRQCPVFSRVSNPSLLQ